MICTLFYVLSTLYKDLYDFNLGSISNKVNYFNIPFVHENISSVQWLSCVQLCNPMDGTMLGFPVHENTLRY